jgi:hypothetical protein
MMPKDISAKKLHIVDLERGPASLQTINTKMAVGVTADIEGRDDIILTGGKDGVTKFDPMTGNHEYLTRLWTESEGPEKVRRSAKEKCCIQTGSLTPKQQNEVE